MFLRRISLVAMGVIAASMTFSAGPAPAAGAMTCEFPRYISISDDVRYEGTGGGSTTLTFTVYADGGCSHAASVSYPTLSTADYHVFGQTLSWADGDETMRTIVVDINRDSFDESNETFSIPLTTVTGWNHIDGPGTGTILDDDGPKPKWNISDSFCDEGDPSSGPLKTCKFWVSRSKPTMSGETLTVKFQTFNITAKAGTDYDPPPGNLGTVTIPPQTYFNFGSVQIHTNDLCKADKTLQVKISAPSDGGVLADSTSIMTIKEDDWFCDL